MSWLILALAAYQLLRGRNRRSWVLAAASLLLAIYGARAAPPLERLTYHLPGINVFLKRVQGFGPAIFFVQFLALRGISELGSRARSPRRALALTVPLMVAIIALHYAPLLVHIESHRADYMLSPLFREAAAGMDPRARYYLAAPLLDEATDLYPQEGMVFERPEVFGWNRVPPRRYMDLIERISPEYIKYEQGKLAGIGFVFNQSNGAFLRSPALPLIDLLGVRYLLDQGMPVGHASPSYLSWMLPPDQLRDRAALPQWRDLLVLQKPLTVTFPAAPHQVIGLRLAWDSCSPAGAGGPVAVMLQDRQAEPMEQTAEAACGAGGPGRTEALRWPLSPENEGHRTVMLQARAPEGLTFTRFRFKAAAVEDDAAPFTLIASTAAFDVFQNREALPLAFLGHRIVGMDSEELLLDRLARGNREELARTAFLASADVARSAELSGPGPGEVGGAVEEFWRRPGAMMHRVMTTSPAVLIVTENRLPGWTALVDGIKRPVFYADHAFMGVPLGPGGHEVRLSYRPAGFRLGLWLSLASVAALAGAALLFRRVVI